MIEGDKKMADDESRKGSAKSKDEPKEVPLGETYQRAGQIRQMINEIANLKIFDNTERIKAIEKDLKAIGFEGDPHAELTDESGPVGRSTRQERTVSTDAPVRATSTVAPPATATRGASTR